MALEQFSPVLHCLYLCECDFVNKGQVDQCLCLLWSTNNSLFTLFQNMIFNLKGKMRHCNQLTGSLYWFFCTFQQSLVIISRCVRPRLWKMLESLKKKQQEADLEAFLCCSLVNKHGFTHWTHRLSSWATNSLESKRLLLNSQACLFCLLMASVFMLFPFFLLHFWLISHCLCDLCLFVPRSLEHKPLSRWLGLDFWYSVQLKLICQL